MGTDAPAILVLDASVLINFLRVERIDLVRSCTSKLLITEHVRHEVTARYPEQLTRLDAALAVGLLETIVLTDLAELQTIADLSTSSAKRLGIGECSAVAAAVHRGFELAIDDKAAIREARARYPSLPLHTTQDLVVLLIRRGAIDVAAADALKEEWKVRHRFRLKIASFQELL